MAKLGGLGKGMAALLQVTETVDESKKYFVCPIEQIRPNRNQPRKHFAPEKLEELAASIREKGIIQPLVVTKKEDHYQIIAGERRWRASQKAGLREIPVVIQDVSEDWALEMALIENIQREDLNPIEEAEAYRNLMENFDFSQEEMARRVGKDRSTVANSLRLLRLPEGVREDVMHARLSMGHARALLSLDNDEDLLEARDQVVQKALSVRETEALVKKIKSFGAPGKARKKPQVNPQLQHLESELKKALGTQVKINSRGKGGKIEIAFYSPEELNRLLEFLGVA